MTTTEELLKYSTRGAIVRMVNEENGTLFDGSQVGPLVISEPLNVGGVRTEVELSVRRQIHQNDALPFPGRIAFRFNRLDVGHTLGGYLDGFRPTLPTSTRVLMDEITRRSGIVLEDEDFVLEEIVRFNAMPYVLRAKSESLRWTGSLSVVLVDLIDLHDYLTTAMPNTTIQLSEQSELFSKAAALPYINITADRQLYDQIALNDPITEENDPLVTLLRRAVPAPGHYLSEVRLPWTVSSLPAPYNLYGAKLIERARRVRNPVNMNLDHAYVLELGPLCTGFSDRVVELPYDPTPHRDTTFYDKPRMSTIAVVNASDGTAWNVWLNSLVAPSLITQLPPDMVLNISGQMPWVAVPDRYLPTNLYNAVVQYNGQRRTSDQRPYNTSCNRIVVLTVSDYNSAYRGNLNFHYRAPIILDEQLPEGVVGRAFAFSLNPSEGVAPYQTRISSGALASDYTLTADHRIVGSGTRASTSIFTVEVTDSRNVKVYYSYVLRTVVAPMSLSLTLPDAPVNQPYQASLIADGGVPPYAFSLESGSAVPGLSLNPVTATFTGTPVIRGTYQLDVRMTDDRGESIVERVTLKVV